MNEFTIGQTVRVKTNGYVGTVILTPDFPTRLGMVRVKFADGDFTDAYVSELESFEALTTPETVAQANYWYEQGKHDERQKIVQEVADGSLRKVFQGAEDRGYKRAQDEWTAIGIDQWDLAWASGELKARITARARFEEACETVGREELTLQEILTVLNGETLPDPLFHDYDGHNSCTRCGQKAYNSGAEGPCPNHPNRNRSQ
jgi:hypothetical protein